MKWTNQARQQRDREKERRYSSISAGFSCFCDCEHKLEGWRSLSTRNSGCSQSDIFFDVPRGKRRMVLACGVHRHIYAVQWVSGLHHFRDFWRGHGTHAYVEYAYHSVYFSWYLILFLFFRSYFQGTTIFLMSLSNIFLGINYFHIDMRAWTF